MTMMKTNDDADESMKFMFIMFAHPLLQLQTVKSHL